MILMMKQLKIWWQSSWRSDDKAADDPDDEAAEDLMTKQLKVPMLGTTEGPDDKALMLEQLKGLMMKQLLE